MHTTNLGLVCLTSPNVRKEDKISYRTITRTSLLKLTQQQQRDRLTSIYADNAAMLLKAIYYCHNHGIKMYRMSSSAYPFADRPEFRELLPAAALAAAGAEAARLGIRVLSHPDQFCVLSSAKPDVIANSIAILELEAHVFDLIGLPQSNYNPINIHIGSKGDLACQTITSVIRDLPDNIRLRLSLENDECKQNADATAKVCEDTGVAFLLDFHHELVSAKLDSYDHPSLDFFRGWSDLTWDRPGSAVYHLSNGATSLHDNKHSDLITLRPIDLSQVDWLEIEAKGKELAIAAFPW